MSDTLQHVERRIRVDDERMGRRGRNVQDKRGPLVVLEQRCHDGVSERGSASTAGGHHRGLQADVLLHRMDMSTA